MFISTVAAYGRKLLLLAVLVVSLAATACTGGGGSGSAGPSFGGTASSIWDCTGGALLGGADAERRCALGTLLRDEAQQEVTFADDTESLSIMVAVAMLPERLALETTFVDEPQKRFFDECALVRWSRAGQPDALIAGCRLNGGEWTAVKAKTPLADLEAVLAARDAKSNGS